jgi:hypothetical protein
MASAMENVATNGQAGPVAVVQGGALAVPTLLGRTAPRIPVAGRIRAGIKVLTRRAAENERVRAIYERGVEQGKSFDSIEREIADAVPDLKNPLAPKNVPYFTVRGEDFPNPEIARQITDLFGEDRGDGVKRLYRFPVVFPADAWQSVMPHELVAWTANERRFWSEYAADGQTRYCMSHAPVPVVSGTRRAIRVWGGRKTMRRADNGGLCDPESCAEYQDRKCNLSGRFIFFIPGIKSISAFELPTNSFYAMNAAIQKFQTIGFMRGRPHLGLPGRQAHAVLPDQAAGRSAADRRGGPAGAHFAVADRTRGAGRRGGAAAARRRTGRCRSTRCRGAERTRGRACGPPLRWRISGRRRWRDRRVRLFTSGCTGIRTGTRSRRGAGLAGRP